jgi:hypothetical protein
MVSIDSCLPNVSAYKGIEGALPKQKGLKVIIAGLSMSKLPDFEGLAICAKLVEERSFVTAALAMGVSVATVSPTVTHASRMLATCCVGPVASTP